VAREFQLEHGVRMFVGEFSAIRWAPGAAKWLEDAISVFEEYGWDWTYHSYAGWNGWNPTFPPDAPGNNQSYGGKATDRCRFFSDTGRRTLLPDAGCIVQRFPSDSRPVVTQTDIAVALAGVGVSSGDTIMVHSSLSSFGYVEGGADALLDGILDVIGAGGTLVMPTITYSEAYYGENPPVFDVTRTPSPCGRATETLRRRSGAIRSLHPLESVVAYGRFAEAVCARHEQSVGPCGPTSPYGRLVALDAWILLVGVGNNRNTTLHVAEELAGLPGLYTPPVMLPLIDAGGTPREMDFVLYTRTPRDFGRADEYLRDISRVTCVGTSRWVLLKARDVIDVMLGVLRRDQGALLQREHPAG